MARVEMYPTVLAWFAALILVIAFWPCRAEAAAMPELFGRDPERQAVLRSKYFPLRLERPRLFLDADRLAQVKANIESDPFLREVYGELLDWAQSSHYWTNMWVAPLQLQGLALTDLLEGGPVAIRVKLLQMVNALLHANYDSWTAPRIAKGLATVHDWLYDQLPPALKQRMAERMLELARFMYTVWRHSDYNNHLYLEYGPLLYVGITLLNEGIDDEAAEQIVLDIAEMIEYHFIPAKQQVGAGDGGWHESMSYHSFHTYEFAQVLEAWAKISGGDHWSTFYGLDGDAAWLYHHLRPHDGSMIAAHNINTPSRLIWEHLYYLPLLQSRRKDGVATSLILDFAKPEQAGDPAAQRPNYIAEHPHPSHWWPVILWFDPGVEPVPRSELPLAQHFRGLGWVSMRSSWQEDATFAHFRSGPYYSGHQHLDQNAFVIHKRGLLAVDAGEYGAKETKYHNTVLIGEGQRYYGNDPRRVVGPVEGTEFDTGRIVAFGTNEWFTYAAGDATGAHTDEVKDHTRHFLYLRPDTFVVFDRVETASPTTPKTWLLNSHHPARAIDAATHAVQEGDGELWVQTLLPSEPVFEFERIAGGQRNLEASQLRVSPAAPAKVVYFLHVLTAGERGMSAEPARVEENDNRYTVTLTRGDYRYRIIFEKDSRSGSIVIEDDAGRVVASHSLSEFTVGTD